MQTLNSKISSEELEVLFKESNAIEQFFFPKKVPVAPAFEDVIEPLTSGIKSAAEDE